MRRIRARVLDPVGPEAVQWWPDAEVRVEGGRITHVGPWTGGVAEVDAREGVLTPGFVDAHVHYPQARIVGAATGPLLDWLQRSTFPEEARFAEPTHAERVADVFTASLAAAGTTLAMVYASVHPAACEALFQAVDRRGLRAIAGPVLMDRDSPPALTLPADQALPAVEALAARWHGRDGRLEVAVIPRFALSCSPALLAGAGALSRRLGLWATTHLSENLDECRVARDRFAAADYLSIYEQAGLLHARSVYAHCVHLAAAEWDRFAAAGAVVAHCPDSNFFLGSGRMPTRAALERGIPIALGTDIAAGRSYRVPRIASSAYDNALATGLTLSPERLLWWATAGGAAALGHPELGRVAPGYEADLVWHDLPEWVDDAAGALAWLLFDHDAPRPRRTWVRGEPVWDRDAAGASYPWRAPAR